jgi:YVTN family beta-propeller protein
VKPQGERAKILAMTLVALAFGSLVAISGNGLPAGAVTSYTAIVVNNQYPTSNSITEVTGSGSSWSPGSPLVIGSGNLGLTSIAYAPNGATAYLAEGGENQIVPITISDFEAGTPFGSGGTVPFQDAVTPNGNELLVTNNGSNNLAVISTSDTSDVTSVSVGDAPFGIAVLPDGSAAYVTNTDSDTVSVVSLVGTPTVTKTISLPAKCKTPYYDSVTPTGKAVYVSCQGNDYLWKITVSTNKAATTGIKVPHGGVKGSLHQTVISGNSKVLYATSGNDVYPITLKTGQVGAAIPLTDAQSIAISPDGTYLMAGDNELYSDTVEVIATSDNQIVDTFSAGGYAHFSIQFQP